MLAIVPTNRSQYGEQSAGIALALGVLAYKKAQSLARLRFTSCLSQPLLFVSSAQVLKMSQHNYTRIPAHDPRYSMNPDWTYVQGPGSSTESAYGAQPNTAYYSGVCEGLASIQNCDLADNRCHIDAPNNAFGDMNPPMTSQSSGFQRTGFRSQIPASRDVDDRLQVSR